MLDEKLHVHARKFVLEKSFLDLDRIILLNFLALKVDENLTLHDTLYGPDSLISVLDSHDAEYESHGIF